MPRPSPAMMMSQFLLILQSLFCAVFPLALAWAALSDWRQLQIANGVCVLIALAFLPAALLAGFSAFDLAQHYGAGLALFTIGAFLFWRGLFGGGDVKLLAASGLWFQWTDLGLFLLAVALFGGVLALLILVVRNSKRLSGIFNSMAWLEGSGGLNQPVPYGVAIAAAALTLSARLPVLPPYVADMFNN